MTGIGRSSLGFATPLQILQLSLKFLREKILMLSPLLELEVFLIATLIHLTSYVLPLIDTKQGKL